MTRGRGRGKGGDGFTYRRDNKFNGNRKGKQNRDHGDRNEYYGGDDRPNYGRDRDDNNGGGFRKFTGTSSMSSRGYKHDQHHNFNSRKYNNHNTWVHNQRPNENPFQPAKDMQIENRHDEQENNSKHAESATPLEEQAQNNEPIRLKLKTEKPDHTPVTKQKNKPAKGKPEQPSSNESASEKEDTQSKKAKSNEVSNPVPNIKIKKEQMDASRTEKKEIVNKPTPTPRKTIPPAPQESSSSDSSSSSSSEDEEPQMPHPMRGGDIKPKKEKKSEDDVVCLGKMNNSENLVDNADSDDPTVCMVCNKSGHSADACQMKCRKCSHSSYLCQMVCKNCGETYTNGVKSLPKPPNPFIMFMQFMQFCMSQYGDMFTDTKYQYPPCENPVHCPEPTQNVEVSRKDIENSKTNRKRNKSESKQSRKKSRKNSQRCSDDDSDSSSLAASSTKKRKKRTKSITRETETPPTAQQQQPFGQHFGQSYPNNLPFAGSFNAPGFNPMMAFSQMMGYNPVAMNFPR